MGWRMRVRCTWTFRKLFNCVCSRSHPGFIPVTLVSWFQRTLHLISCHLSPKFLKVQLAFCLMKCWKVHRLIFAKKNVAHPPLKCKSWHLLTFITDALFMDCKKSHRFNGNKVKLQCLNTISVANQPVCNLVLCGHEMFYRPWFMSCAWHF